VWGDIMGCFMLFPLTGIILVMTAYMSSMMVFFAAVATYMSMIFSVAAVYLTAFFFMVFG
jgi:hypothetical protein